MQNCATYPLKQPEQIDANKPAKLHKSYIYSTNEDLLRDNNQKCLELH